MAVKFKTKEARDEYLRSLREPPTVVGAPPKCSEPYGPWTCHRPPLHDGPHEGLVSDVDAAVVLWPSARTSASQSAVHVYNNPNVGQAMRSEIWRLNRNG